MKKRTSLLGNAAIYSASNILNSALPFFLLPIMTRLLPPKEYGVIAMFTVLLGIMGAFTGLSVQGAVNSRYVDREEIDFPNYVGSSLWVLLFSTLITGVVVGILRHPLSQLAAVPIFWLFMSIGVSFCAFIVQIRLSIWLMAREPINYGVLQIGMSTANVCLSVGLVLWVIRNADGRLWGQTIATVSFGVIALVSMVRGGWIDMRLNSRYIREIVHFGLPLIPHVIGGFLLASADRLVVNERLGLHEAGIYMVAAQLGMGMGVVADAFNKAFVPWLYEKLKEGGDENEEKIVRGTWIYFLIALATAMVVAVLAPWLVALAAGKAYGDASGALAWIALGQAFNGMYLMVTNYIFYARKTGLLGWFTLSSGVLGVAASWMLIPYMGLSGAGVGFALGMLAKFLLTWILSYRAYPMPWFQWKVLSRYKSSS